MVVRAQKRLPDARPFVPAWLTAAARRRGSLAPIPNSSRRSIGAIRWGSARCGWSRGCSAALTIDMVEGDERGRGLVEADGLLESDRGEPAAARQCLCAADRRRPTKAGASCAASAGAGQRGQRRAGLAGRHICIAPAGQAVRIERARRAGAAAGRAYQGAAPARRPLWDGLHRGGDRPRRACTIAPAGGTRRCSTMRRGRAGR